jgi:hypothetical protein
MGVQPWPATASAICTWLTKHLLGAGSFPPVKPDSAMSELSALRAYHIDNGLPDTIFDLHAKHFRRMVDRARRLQPPHRKRVRNPISRASVITLSRNISHPPAQSLRLSEAQKNDLKILPRPPVSPSPGSFRSGNLHTYLPTLETLKSSLLPS